MELECRQQAEHGFGNLDCDSRKVLVLGHGVAWQTVEAAPDTLQLPGSGQTCQHHPRRADGVQVAGAQEALLVEQGKSALGM